MENHLVHAQRYCVPELSTCSSVLDLGSGAGVPGLALAVLYPNVRWTLVDAMAKRCAFLRYSVDALLLRNVDVLEGRAEELGRMAKYRSAFDAVTARSFGRPAVLVECASPFLRMSGLLIVSEPPDDVDRWPSSGLDLVGMVKIDSVFDGIAVFEQMHLCPEVYPRRTGVPSKRPLF